MLLRLSVALSVVALLVLAGLQYHWIGQIAVSERQRLQRSVEESSREFADDLFTELRSIGNALEPRFPSATIDPALVAGRYREWVSEAAYPNIVKAVYLVRTPSEVLQLDPASATFQVVPSTVFVNPLVPGNGRFSTDRELIVMPLNRRFPGPRGPEPPPPPDRDPGNNGMLFVELNHDVIVEQVLPRLVASRFLDYEGREYRVAVTAAGSEDLPRTVFTSGDSWSGKDLATPDYAMDLLGPNPPPQRRGNGPGGPGPQRGGRGERGERGERGRGPEQRGPIMLLPGQNWRLLVKHRAGSVETAVTSFRNRNLALSFGVLVVLGISAVAIVVSSVRARRLGQLQMEFAAGISHELRTPIAVIQSAAHNLGSGVVQDREGIEEYAAIVKGEARRLTEMVEQVMAYTETQSGRKNYVLGPVDVSDVVETAIRNLSSVLHDGNATVQTNIDPGLPHAMADVPALTRCLQNLLSNAVKYGRNNESARIEIHGRHIPAAGSAGRVEISVVDHGPGVPERDIKQLFEAFHRGSNASTNTPGNGLGLHLVSRIMEAQNGTVAYQPVPDNGARFTLTLQAARSAV